METETISNAFIRWSLNVNRDYSIYVDSRDTNDRSEC